jgi:hypothetical protein
MSCPYMSFSFHTCCIKHEVHHYVILQNLSSLKATFDTVHHAHSLYKSQNFSKISFIFAFRWSGHEEIPTMLGLQIELLVCISVYDKSNNLKPNCNYQFSSTCFRTDFGTSKVEKHCCKGLCPKTTV